jgi:uncharacterized damage-inducible protein DinB
MNAQLLIQSYTYTFEIVQDQLENVTHEESLVPFIDGGHSINWLVGHLVSSRTVPLQHVNAKLVWSEDRRARYRNGSAPINQDAPDVVRLPELMNLFDQTQERLVSGLKSLTPDQISAPSGYGRNTVVESLMYFHFHETYHVGQLTMVAEFLGKPAAYVRPKS